MSGPEPSGLVGIVANPASGKDIRRLVAHGSTFDNNEKINIVRRVLTGLAATGVGRVAYMPDTHAIVPRAAAGTDLGLALVPLPMPTLGAPSDSFEAARRLADLGAGAIVTLGGDGTNRLVAKGCADVPLVPISTGTNNVFPRMVEGTLAGLAAGLVATGVVGGRARDDRAVRRLPRLDVLVDGEPRDAALIDVATIRPSPVGARALWDPRLLSEVVLSRVAAAEIGLASLGGLLFPHSCARPAGVHLVVVEGSGSRTLLAPLAPGLIRLVAIAAAALLPPGATVELARMPCTVALDGEREFEIVSSRQTLSVELNPSGPRTVDIEATLQAGAKAGVFRQELERRASRGPNIEG
ncbi:MAG: NAD(+)/NADH kinase [Chloroflexota bacterium]|nr:NAD(+)/NADH kinase [Chloroflexota bacterium]